MRIAVIIIVILGSIATAGLGAKWLSDYSDTKQQVDSLKNLASSVVDEDSTESKVLDSAFEDYESYKTKGIVLIACGVISLLSLFLQKKLGKILVIILLAAGIAPAFFDPATLIFTFLLILGGILSFFIKPKTQTA